MYVYCNGPQIKSQRVKNKKVQHETKLSGVTVVFTRCDVFCDLLQYTHTRKNVDYLFYTIKIKLFYTIKRKDLKDLWDYFWAGDDLFVPYTLCRHL